MGHAPWEVIARARDLFAPEVVSFIERQLRPAVALTPDPSVRTRSRFGGLPDLAEGELLRLFIPLLEDQEDFFWGDPGFVRALFTAAPVAPMDIWPDEIEDEDRVEAVGLRMELVWDLPRHPELVDDWPFEDWSEDFADFLDELRPVEHLVEFTDFTSLGYDPAPEGSIPLLTLSSLGDFTWSGMRVTVCRSSSPQRPWREGTSAIWPPMPAEPARATTQSCFPVSGGRLRWQGR